MECLWTKIISKNLPHIWASTLVQNFWTKCYLGYSLLGMILVKSIQFRYIYWNPVNLRWIIDNVIIHHNHNVFIRNTIFMENLVGMAYISLNTRKWTCHLKFSLKRASNYFHSQEVIMVIPEEGHFKKWYMTSYPTWNTLPVSEVVKMAHRKSQRVTHFSENQGEMKEVKHLSENGDGIIIHASQPSWPSFR